MHQLGNLPKLILDQLEGEEVNFMHYMPYMLKYLPKKIDEYNKSSVVSKEQIHEAQMLLKEVLDLEDQGYINSFNTLVENLDIVNVLSDFLRKHNAEIIRPIKKIGKVNPNYNPNKYELEEYIDKMKGYVNKVTKQESSDPLLLDIMAYSKWLYQNYDSSTTYIFLLRDTLLPYLAFAKWNPSANNIKPWLIGRKWLALFRDEKEIKSSIESKNFGDNDELYETIYECLFTALDQENEDFNTFAAIMKDEFWQKKANFSKVISSLTNLLKTIKTEKIMVIESGRFASIPMLLKCIDDRVDFRLFTTTPQFYGVYKNKFFSYEYDKNRLFENLSCQDDLIRFAGFNNNHFFVQECCNDDLIYKAVGELNIWYKLCDQNKS